MEEEMQEAVREEEIQSVLSVVADSKTSSGYLCGSCGHINQLSGTDQIRCHACGYKILYKRRQRVCMIGFAIIF